VVSSQHQQRLGINEKRKDPASIQQPNQAEPTKQANKQTKPFPPLDPSIHQL